MKSDKITDSGPECFADKVWKCAFEADADMRTDKVLQAAIEDKKISCECRNMFWQSNCDSVESKSYKKNSATAQDLSTAAQSLKLKKLRCASQIFKLFKSVLSFIFYS